MATVDYKNGVLKINDKEFKIPNGYNQEDNMTATGENANISGADNAKMSRATFLNGDKTIVVKYIYIPNSALSSYHPFSDNPQNKTINDHAGTLEFEKDNTVVFSYIDNEKLIQINAPDEATLNEILK